MIKERIGNHINNNCITMLGVGPVSKNCVDAALDLANEFEKIIFLIASRGQIEAEAFGGGYANNWSTESFAEYVAANDKKGKIIMARDHGGPWQGAFEKANKQSYRESMETAKQSFKTDILSGFEMIHIDCSVDIFGNPGIDEILYRSFELYEYCWSVAQEAGKEIVFEIGAEEQNECTTSLEELEYALNKTFAFCSQNKLPTPLFIVVQTGTKVMETRNIGSFDSPFRIAHEIPSEIQIPKILEICNKYNVFIKEHNADYLSDETLRWHPKLGIHSVNVAPEFGVEETRAFIALLKENKMFALADEFIDMAYSSGKWKKWLAPNSKAGKKVKAEIAGHYVFMEPEFHEIKAKADKKLKKQNIDIDEHLKNVIKTKICRYLRAFRII